MSDNSKIEWTEATWNVVSGCTKISDGCLKCYIERTPPFRIAHRRFDGSDIGATTGVMLHPERLTLPLRWKKPRLIFANSLSDLFHEDVPDELIAQSFAVMALTPRHTYQLLTKRHARMRSLLNSGKFAELVWLAAGDIAGRDEAFPLPAADYDAVMARFAERVRTDDVMAPWPNIWLGVSCENQRWADIRIPALLETPAAVRFVSAEPLLGPVDLTDWIGGWSERRQATTVLPAAFIPYPRLHWLIAGGESGPGAQPMDVEWVRDLVKQCDGTPTAVFVKQLGAVWASDWTVNGKTVSALGDRKGGEWDYWPTDLRVREFPALTS